MIIRHRMIKVDLSVEAALKCQKTQRQKWKRIPNGININKYSKNHKNTGWLGVVEFKVTYWKLADMSD